MSAPAFFHALGEARARWLSGDPDAWAHYSASCLRLEAELRSTQRACSPSPRCSCARAACRPPEATPRPTDDVE